MGKMKTVEIFFFKEEITNTLDREKDKCYYIIHQNYEEETKETYGGLATKRWNQVITVIWRNT